MRNEGKTVFEMMQEGLESTLDAVKSRKPVRITHVVVPEPPPAYSAADVARIRARLNMSQASFAALLAVSKRTVEKWEQGKREPTSGTARLLQFLEQPDLLSKFVLKADVSSNDPVRKSRVKAS